MNFSLLILFFFHPFNFLVILNVIWLYQLTSFEGMPLIQYQCLFMIFDFSNRQFLILIFWYLPIYFHFLINITKFLFSSIQFIHPFWISDFLFLRQSKPISYFQIKQHFAYFRIHVYFYSSHLHFCLIIPKVPFFNSRFHNKAF